MSSMYESMRPSSQSENFRGNDANPWQDAGWQAYTPDTKIIFQIDCSSKSADAALPSVQICFDQDNSPRQNHDIDGRGPFRGDRGHRGDNVPSYSNGDQNQHQFQFRINTDRFFSPEVRHQHDHNPWHHGRGSHPRFDDVHHIMPVNERNNRRFTNDDVEEPVVDAKPRVIDQPFTNDQILNQDSMQWLSSNEVSELRAARTAQEFLEKLFASFQPDQSSPNLLDRLSPPELPTPPGLPSLNEITDLADRLAPPGLPTPSELTDLADRPTPPGLPTPGELFNPGDNDGGYTLPGAPLVADFIDQVPTPPGLPAPREVVNTLDKITPKFLPKIGKLFGWG